MNYLLDTNIWSYLQERHPDVVAHGEQMRDGADLFMSVVTQGEMLGGIRLVEHGPKRSRLVLLYLEALEMSKEILPIDTDTAERYAEIYAALRRKGRPIETNDMWIAATALAHDLVLVTSDAHFQQIDGLSLEDWTKPDSG